MRKVAIGLVIAVLVAIACKQVTQDRVKARRIHRQAGQADTASPTPSPPAEDKGPYRFAVLGDWGEGDANELSIARRMCSYREHHPFDDVITTGDNIYPQGSPDLFHEVFAVPFGCLLDHGVDFHASLGNHDIMTNGGAGQIADPRFGMPKRNYVLREAGVRIVIWDSNSRNRAWLRRALRARSSDRWTIVAFHHPVFSPGTGHGSEPGFRPTLPRLFKRKGVDLVLNGHDHIYSVSKPQKGIRYVVTGGGGAGLYGCTSKTFVDVCKAEHHFLYVKVFPEEIRVAAIPPSGKPIDTFTVSH